MFSKLKGFFNFSRAKKQNNQIARISLSVDQNSYNFDNQPSTSPPSAFDQNLLNKKMSLIKSCLNEARSRAETIIMDLSVPKEKIEDNQEDLRHALQAIAEAADQVVLSGRKILAGDSFMLTYLDDKIDLQLPDLSKITNPNDANQKLAELLAEIEVSENKLNDYFTNCEVSTNNRISAAIDMKEFKDFMDDS